ncbi:MAG: hypothetical protein HS128_19350 [Ideonella sp.]|nr:hypothetical protein [Ideonella sp.]MCC7455952.1 hypothetical protein [Nitrospira sp.]
MTAAVNPFAQLMALHMPVAPATVSAQLVVAGRVITDARQLRHLGLEPDEYVRLRDELRRAKKRAYYQRRKQDPHFIAVRHAWAEANRTHVRAYKLEYDARTREHQRELKTAWARRKYHEDPEKFRAVQREYYARHREQCIAASQARYQRRKAARAAAANNCEGR